MKEIITTYVKGIVDLIHISEQEPNFFLIEKIFEEEVKDEKTTND